MYQGELARFFRWPYQAKVMNKLDTASISAVTNSGLEMRFMVQLEVDYGMLLSERGF
jgi:hypothetical protein